MRRKERSEWENKVVRGEPSAKTSYLRRAEVVLFRNGPTISSKQASSHRTETNLVSLFFCHPQQRYLSSRALSLRVARP